MTNYEYQLLEKINDRIIEAEKEVSALREEYENAVNGLRIWEKKLVTLRNMYSDIEQLKLFIGE